MTRPNPHIALIYHYDLARALAGEVVDWQIIPVNVDAGREGGDLCRAAADFAKRRDLFAMPAPTRTITKADVWSVSFVDGDWKPELRDVSLTAHPLRPEWTAEIAAPDPSALGQPAADPEPPIVTTAGGDGSAATIDRLELIDRIKDLIRKHPEAEPLLRAWWPDGVPTLKHEGHTDDQLAQILAAVREVEAGVGASWVEGDVTSRSGAINRARKAWKDSGRDENEMWFAATCIATYEQCRNPDATLDGLIRQFTIEQANRLTEQATNQ